MSIVDYKLAVSVDVKDKAEFVNDKAGFEKERVIAEEYIIEFDIDFDMSFEVDIEVMTDWDCNGC